eukprot:CAMPEP_0171118514 /NCGR_PEP_ID=MMETSP0766_2-20121228/94912_1 /TAXON_ID=439317 /ORGANISM="Gambierdiscus australes, Strain CAWD 149" /LENGTH=50 /DNA_ID=CAMNT_0011581105 /DNA_START=109 /DNA_END=258 /DNA_ORIENTATION=-
MCLTRASDTPAASSASSSASDCGNRAIAADSSACASLSAWASIRQVVAGV